ncbi:LysR family transcriptional regulator [Paracraurococcus ruber]|uniref:LysR family transcriptional regulator n=1 Tax=Paracraurococcus ruber TaxID=77675 RepID=A0ABS1D0R8_9PROT|nr:LysR family transcriptional regulator [Paracraurococcus ruber]MBK1659702.1 LysR family transcriptional regulator [Paracraurococcus ruber]TDG30418.1 LysR family transcriptional regulator [Paracraurococcus ruber]
MDLLLHFRAFVRVAELGGFSAAARALNTSQPAVSRQVADLEARLGARLLHRSSTGVSLTEEGRAFLDAARQALDSADGALGAVGARRGEVAGEVRLGAPLAFGRLHIVPRLPALLERHLGLSLDLVLGDAFGDLVQDGLDATIRIGVVTDPGLIVRRIGLTRRVTVASPAYLAKAGAPRHPDDLAKHDCLRFAGLSTGDTWVFERAGEVARVPVTGRFRASASDAVRTAVLAGMGIFVAPVWLFGPEIASGEVVTLLEDWAPPAVPIQVATSSRRQVPPRVRAVTDHLAAEFRLDPLLTDYGMG